VTLNIEAVANLRALSESGLPNSQKAVESLTSALGRPRTLTVLIGGIALWTAYNGWAAPLAKVHPFDPPPFFWLQGLVSLYAALVTTMILTTQSRQNREAEARAHLELQVSLMAEQMIVPNEAREVHVSALQPSRTRGAHVCPSCGSQEVARSHAAVLPLRIFMDYCCRRRLYRCLYCWMRFWAKPGRFGAAAVV